MLDPAATTQPGSFTATPTLQVVLDGLRATASDTTWRGWAVLFGAILAGFVVGHVVKKACHALGANRLQRKHDLRAAAYEAVANPASLIILTVGVSVGLGGVAMSDVVRWFAGRALALTYIAGCGWLLFNLIDVVELFLKRVAARTTSNLDDQMVPLVRKALRLFLVIVLALFTLENVFDRDVSAWLAGLGIAGLAITFAAQDSIKNFFGSLTILFDRPFQLGDLVVIDGHTGNVEDIGFRSTRVRRADGVLVTIPNSKVVDQSLQNISRRRNLQRTIVVPLALDTPPDQLARAIQLAKDVLAEPDVVAGLDAIANPPRVFLSEVRVDAIVLQLMIWYANTGDWWGFQAACERIHLRVLQQLAASDIRLAAPPAVARPLQT
jgi:MscS family membrane protein